jgi:hypothetical protein
LLPTSKTLESVVASIPVPIIPRYPGKCRCFDAEVGWHFPASFGLKFATSDVFVDFNHQSS